MTHGILKKENKMEKLSVIVPVYNVYPYLRQCLESIINQTYKNLEIIIVNDASPYIEDDEITKISYDTWIAPLGIKSIEGNNIVFTTLSEFQRDVIENKYKPLIFNTLKYITNKEWTFSVIDLSKEQKMGKHVIMFAQALSSAESAIGPENGIKKGCLSASLWGENL